jgi:hypothetical protein
MSSVPSTQPKVRQVRRRGLATVATLAGVGASLSLFALSPTTALTSTAIVPAAGAPASAGSIAAPSRAVAAAAAPAAEAVSAPAAKSVPVTRSAPAAKAAPTHEMAASSATACGGLQSAVDAFLMHFNAAHLETSPGQQVADALSVDQYTKTHTVLLGNMLKPLLGGAQAGLDAFLQHVYAAHLEASPGQQVADIADINQYVKTHTVMIENMVKPFGGADLSAC